MQPGNLFAYPRGGNPQGAQAEVPLRSTAADAINAIDAPQPIFRQQDAAGVGTNPVNTVAVRSEDVTWSKQRIIGVSADDWLDYTVVTVAAGAPALADVRDTNADYLTLEDLQVNGTSVLQGSEGEEPLDNFLIEVGAALGAHSFAGLRGFVDYESPARVTATIRCRDRQGALGPSALAAAGAGNTHVHDLQLRGCNVIVDILEDRPMGRILPPSSAPWAQ